MTKFKIDVKIKTRLSFFYSFMLFLYILFYVMRGGAEIKAYQTTTKPDNAFDTLTNNLSNCSISVIQERQKTFKFKNTTFPANNIRAFQDLMVPKANWVIINNKTNLSRNLKDKI